ncbi:tail fiber protein [Emticicia sp. SJ17W-69]|uniref:tail fiber protein n=1 Tax=Emticicia sp. SJ17W-69 TaxID=3421657 RepID=UPI003EB8D38A
MKTFFFTTILFLSFLLGKSQSITILPSNGIALSDAQQSIKFPEQYVANVPMMYLFAGGTQNTTRMVIAHSPTYQNYGLQYNDVQDKFYFVGAGINACSIDLYNRIVDVNGLTKTNNLQIANGGSSKDFLVKNDVNGNVGFTKGNNRVGISYIISLTGVFPSRESMSSRMKSIDGVAGLNPFYGEITMFAGNFAPMGWAFCDGQLLLISENPALFSILGTTYGGDGRTTFALPDLRAATPVHVGTSNGITYELGEKH